MTDAEFKTLLSTEVIKAESALVNNGDINGVVLNGEQNAINEEWRAVLDDAFQLIADFAQRHKVKDM
jgi:hypothetical protein